MCHVLFVVLQYIYIYIYIYSFYILYCLDSFLLLGQLGILHSVLPTRVWCSVSFVAGGLGFGGYPQKQRSSMFIMLMQNS